MKREALGGRFNMGMAWAWRRARKSFVVLRVICRHSFTSDGSGLKTRHNSPRLKQVPYCASSVQMTSQVLPDTSKLPTPSFSSHSVVWCQQPQIALPRVASFRVSSREFHLVPASGCRASLQQRKQEGRPGKGIDLCGCRVALRTPGLHSMRRSGPRLPRRMQFR